MDDLSELLDASTVVSCPYMGTTINLDVYTAGANRLTHEEIIAFREMNDRYAPERERISQMVKEIDVLKGRLDDSPNDEAAQAAFDVLSRELDALADTVMVEIGRITLPSMLKGWSFNGTPMKRNGELFPPTKENIATIPDRMLLAVGGAAQAVWQNPTTSESANGSEQPDNQSSLESSPTETITPSAISDSPQDGSAVTEEVVPPSVAVTRK